MPEPDIPPPSGDREVLKVNVFERMISANTVLLPLFPYLGPGAIVVAGGLVGGGPDALGHGSGAFHHENTQQEVTVTFGSAGFVREPGDVAVNPDTHPNHNFFTEDDPPEHVALVTVTQRQSDECDAGRQRESIRFHCERCGELLYEFGYTAAPGRRPRHGDEEPAGEDTDVVPMFPTLWGTLHGSRRFAADESLRTCAACGHRTTPYDPTGIGCHRFVAQHRSANIARRSLLRAAADGAR